MVSHKLTDDDLERFKEYRSKHDSWGSLNYTISKKIVETELIRQFASHSWRIGDIEGASLLEIWVLLSPSQRQKVLRYAEPRIEPKPEPKKVSKRGKSNRNQ